MTYFEMKQRKEEILNRINAISDKKQKNKHFISQMEAFIIELLRKITFKAKVIESLYDTSTKSTSLAMQTFLEREK